MTMIFFCLLLVFGTQANKGVHFDYNYGGEAETEKVVNSIVVGAAGSGKTTFIEFMSKTKTVSHDLSKFGAGADSKTLEVTKSNTVILKHKAGFDRLKLTFWDTVGLGAHDIDVASEAIKMVEAIVHEPDLHNVLVFQKMERIRKDVLNDLREVVTRFARLGAKKEHLKVILTFSAPYKSSEVNKFKESLGKELKDLILPANIHPINFVRLDELNEDFRPVYESILAGEYDRSIQLLVQNSDPFRPQKALMDNPETKARIRTLAEGDSTWIERIKGLFSDPGHLEL